MAKDSNTSSVKVEPAPADAWDTSNLEEFYEYYALESATEGALERFRRICDLLLAFVGPERAENCLDVADIGCNAGTNCRIWAELGHRVQGVDISEPLIELARKRAVDAGQDIRFHVASATDLPFDDESIDVCIVPELLEHVGPWERCLDEFARVLRPNGVVYITTSNWLCPKQNEFNLPLYSWYPGILKRHYERLAMTTRPDLANYATYPAVNWFSPYSLAAAFRARGFTSADRFDLATYHKQSITKNAILWLIRSLPPARLLAHMCSVTSRIIAKKEPGADRRRVPAD